MTNKELNTDAIHLDFERKARRAFPETIFGEGKATPHLRLAIREMLEATGEVFVTRLTEERFEALGTLTERLDYDPLSRTAMAKEEGEALGTVAVVTAGTADVPVAEECARTLSYFGIGIAKHYDLGVAGIQRLFRRIESIRRADAIVVIAGMDGALPSVVAGLVEVPVIAVPTSVGYGAAFSGVAPLLSMLNSCAEGVSVVNIDNGYGAAYQAGQIVRAIYSKRR